MPHRVRFIYIFFPLLMLFINSVYCEAADEKWQVGLAPSYTSGNFGTDRTTGLTYVPLSVRRLFTSGDVTLVIPYVSITGTGAVTLVGGVPNRVTTSPISGGGQSKRPGQTLPTSSTDDGLGDVILRGRYYVMEEGDMAPLIALTGRLKFPTADEHRGLGTGEFDKGFGMEVTKQLTGKIITFVDLGYTVVGKPDNVPFRNQWNYDLGVGYYVTKNLLASVYYEEFRALIADLPNPRDLLFAMNYRATSALRMNGSVLVGLSNGAPDYGLTGGISVRF